LYKLTRRNIRNVENYNKNYKFAVIFYKIGISNPLEMESHFFLFTFWITLIIGMENIITALHLMHSRIIVPNRITFFRS